MSHAAMQLNPKAEVARRGQALQLNINAALGLQDVLKTNLGPKGTIKMYVLCRRLLLGGGVGRVWAARGRVWLSWLC